MQDGEGTRREGRDCHGSEDDEHNGAVVNEARKRRVEKEKKDRTMDDTGEDKEESGGEEESRLQEEENASWQYKDKDVYFNETYDVTEEEADQYGGIQQSDKDSPTQMPDRGLGNFLRMDLKHDIWRDIKATEAEIKQLEKELKKSIRKQGGPNQSRTN